VNRASRLALVLCVVAVACLANPLYVHALPETVALPHPAASGPAAARYAPDLRYLASLALSAVGVFALVGALATAFAHVAQAGDDERA